MKKIFAFLSLAAMFVVSCMMAEPDGFDNRAVNSPIFYASMERHDLSKTKTYVDNQLTMRWTKDDEISIFVGNTLNQRYKYDGETGANSGSFTPLSSPGFVAADPLDANYAVYPYASTTEMDASGKIKLTLPAVQTYAEGTFGLGANTMVTATENKSDFLLQFKNLCGYLVVNLYGSGTIKSVTFEGNNGEKIAGKATVTASHRAAPSLLMADDAATSITIDCGDGVELGPTVEAATEFWFCIPPVTFSKGFTIRVKGSSGFFSKSTTGSRTIERNVRISMPALEFVPEGPAVPEMVDLCLPSGLRWASFNLGATKPDEYGSFYQWAGLVDVTGQRMYLGWDNCPYHNTGSSDDRGWTKYIPSNRSSRWSGSGSPDNKTVLEPEDDIAHVTYGGSWRMPTYEEWIELIENCTRERTTINGVNGVMFKSKKSGRSIFLPAGGRRDYASHSGVGQYGDYWTSSIYESQPEHAMYMNDGHVAGGADCRYYGRSVRPVSE